MITLCTVVPDNTQTDFLYKDFADIMIDSMLRNTKFITNVLIASPSYDRNLTEFKTIREWTIGQIKFHQFYCPSHQHEFGHADGLHACIDLATTSHLLFCDPDLFFYSAVDELYLNLMNKYDLQYVGCSHHSAVANAYSFFPYVMNSLVKKEDLPPPTWLKGLLKYRGGMLMVNIENPAEDDPSWPEAPGKYLLPSPVPDKWRKLPNLKPNILFDTSVNLCIWGIENNWRWLSFQTIDTHNYSTKYYRGNFKITEKIPLQKLIHHCVRTSPKNLKAEYDKFLEGE